MPVGHSCGSLEIVSRNLKLTVYSCFTKNAPIVPYHTFHLTNNASRSCNSGLSETTYFK